MKKMVLFTVVMLALISAPATASGLCLFGLCSLLTPPCWLLCKAQNFEEGYCESLGASEGAACICKGESATLPLLVDACSVACLAGCQFCDTKSTGSCTLSDIPGGAKATCRCSTPI